MFHAAADRPGRDLFLLSLLVLFLELACIRWFSAHVLFLTFFTNTVLLACFVGMSVGCLAARHPRDYLRQTPFWLVLALAAGLGVEALRKGLERHVEVGNQRTPQVVYFGTEYHSQDLARFVVPVEVLGGFFFLVLALTLIGPGQELGRAFARTPDRIRAYTCNVLGSLAGIGLFALASWLELPPPVWFVPIALGLAYFLRREESWSGRNRGAWSVERGARRAEGFGFHAPCSTLHAPRFLLFLAVVLASWTTGPFKRTAGEYLWSPYYRIDYERIAADGTPRRLITVNLIGHQQMRSLAEPYPAYALPYLLHRDAGGTPFRDILIVGAGTGNDVSRALQWASPDAQIDAVEIDPVIQRLGVREHPDRPYSDPRVRVHLDDGRNFLRATDRQYDLIVYALVDSLVLHSSYSNLRLESYLFTRQAFADVRRHLKPDGLFVMSNHFRQGWLIARLRQTLADTFANDGDADGPLVLTLPYRESLTTHDAFDGFTMFLAGHTAPLHRAFAERGAGRIVERGAWSVEREDKTASSRSTLHDPRSTILAPLRLETDGLDLRAATDDWPFLYLREPTVPTLSLRGMAVMGGLAGLLLLWFRPRSGPDGSADPPAEERAGPGLGRFFFLGAGFMLVESKAIVQMALLFGSTWMVNTVVFAAVLLMVLAANVYVGRVRPTRLGPYYAGLGVALGLNLLVPMDAFLGWARPVQVAAACGLTFAPVAFAGVIFAVSFGRNRDPDRAFGANVAGALVGGLAENTSMLLGFQYLLLVAVGFYALSAVARWRIPFRRAGRRKGWGCHTRPGIAVYN